MTEIAPDTPESLGPDLDPPASPFPDTPAGDLLRQIDEAERSAANARTAADQYLAAAEQAEARLASLRAQLEALEAG